jgi:hypothetical protein
MNYEREMVGSFVYLTGGSSLKPLFLKRVSNNNNNKRVLMAHNQIPMATVDHQ